MTSWIDYRTARPLNFPRNAIAGFPARAIVNLSVDERRAAQEMTLAIPANPYIREEIETFIAYVKKGIVEALSIETRQKIRSELDAGFGAVLVSGLPTDQNLPDTPLHGGSLAPDYKHTFVGEALLVGLGLLTDAEPFNFRQEGRGSAPLIDNIVPVPELRTQRGSGGYDNNFSFHCESAWHRKRPDYLVLVGIREAPDAKTLISSTETFGSNSWPFPNIKVENWFRLKAPDLYVQMETAGLPMGTARYAMTPPIQRLDSGLKLNINFNGTDCRDPLAVQWLSSLENYIEANAVGTVISPGNALIINNARVCHTRTGYSPSFDGKSRWFLREYFKKNLWTIDSSSPQEQAIAWNKEDLDELVTLGWMTSNQRLTDEFAKYVFYPEQATALTGRLAQLASIAFHFTPIEGTRIV